MIRVGDPAVISYSDDRVKAVQLAVLLLVNQGCELAVFLLVDTAPPSGLTQASEKLMNRPCTTL